MSTLWTVVRQAHQGPADLADAARQQLIERYGPAIHRYLLGAVRDQDAADELFQEFALRFLRGDFRSADPQRGRFRSLLKTALYHLVIDHHRRRQRQPAQFGDRPVEPAVEDLPGSQSDAEFLAAWRAELMTRTWEALERIERQTAQPFYTVLRLRMDEPNLRSAEMAARLTVQLCKPISAEWVRKRLHFAREKFTELLLDEVASTLERPAFDELEREVIDLGLLEYCKDALERRRG
jgi:RNA polymerase sigma-70 factor (ECF subfamily)